MNEATTQQQQGRGRRARSRVFASLRLLEDLSLDTVLTVLAFERMTGSDVEIMPRRHNWGVNLPKGEVAIALGFDNRKSISAQRDGEGRLSVPMIQGLLEREDLGTAAEKQILAQLVAVVREYDIASLPETLPIEVAGLVGGWVDVVASTRDDRELIPRMAWVFRRWWDVRVDHLANATALADILGKWLETGSGEVVICQGQATRGLREALMNEHGIRAIVETPADHPTRVASVVISAGNARKVALVESAILEIVARADEAEHWGGRKVIPGAVVRKPHYGHVSEVAPEALLAAIVAKLA